MKTIISDIRKEIYKKKIDWNQMEEHIKCLGEKINFYDENFEESILSELYGSCRKNRCDILKLECGGNVTPPCDTIWVEMRGKRKCQATM